MRSRLPSRFMAALISVMATTTLTGCVSYVNIPPIAQDTALNSVNVPPVPVVMAAAAAYARAHFPTVGEEAAIILPASPSERTWEIVEARSALSRGVAVSEAIPPGGAAPVYEIRAIRIRGRSATVDVILPVAEDGRRLLEVRLRGGLTGWRVINARRLFAESDGQRALDPDALDGSPEPPAPGQEDAGIRLGADSGPAALAEDRNLRPIQPVGSIKRREP